MIFGINTMSDISKLLYALVIILQVKFETILKCHEWYVHVCQRSCTNHAIICLYYYCSITLSHSIGNKNNGILQELDGIILFLLCFVQILILSLA